MRNVTIQIALQNSIEAFAVNISRNESAQSNLHPKLGVTKIFWLHFDKILNFLEISEKFWDIFDFRTLVHATRPQSRNAGPLGALTMKRSLSKLEQEQIRIQGVDMYLNGIPPKQIAKQLDVYPQTVYFWIRRYKSLGTSGLVAKSQKGNPKISGRVSIGEIRNLLEKDPTSLGFPFSCWNGPAIVQLIESRFGIKIHKKYIYRWLAKNGLAFTNVRCKTYLNKKM